MTSSSLIYIYCMMSGVWIHLIQKNAQQRGPEQVS